MTRRYLGGGVHTGRGRASFTLNAMHTQTFIAKVSGREQDSRCQINFAGSSSAICIHRRYTRCIRLTSVLLPIEDYHFLHPLSLSFTIGKTFQPFSVQTNPQDPKKKKVYSKLRIQLGKPHHHSFRHLRDLHWAVMGFHSRMYNMGEVLCRKKVFYLKLGI